MKIHRPVVSGIVEALSEIFNKGSFADKVIERSFKANKKWGGRDRRFFAESVYDVVRWWRRFVEANDLAWSDDSFVAFRPENKQPVLSESELMHIFFSWMSFRGYEIPGWSSEFEDFNEEKVRKRFKSPKQSRAMRLSLSDWMDQEGESQLGGELWEESVVAMNQVAPLYLRVNLLKSDVNKVIAALVEGEIEAVSVEGSNELISISTKGRRPNVFRTEAFQKGWFEVQDGGSQKITPFLQVEPGHRVIDACAGAGGKTLHLAVQMQNRGKIISMDVEEWKLKELRKRSSRAGVDIVEARTIESSKTIKRLKESADRLLLDVPCTGVGVLRRNPDTKWRLTKERYDQMLVLQQDILSRYSQMVKPGGKLVYATCSLFNSENEEQVQKFLTSQEGLWELEEEQRIWPQKENFDGFYMARLRRK